MRRSLALALALLFVAGAAQADEPERRLVVARPKSDPSLHRTIGSRQADLHFWIHSLCQPGTGEQQGIATCPVLSVPKVPNAATPAENMLVVLGDAYSVELVIADPRRDAAPESPDHRATRAARAQCFGAAADAPVEVLPYGNRTFIRVGAAEGTREVCYATSDERPEVTTVVFRALDAGIHLVHPDFRLDLVAEATVVMETASFAQPKPTSSSTTSSDGQAPPPRGTTGRPPQGLSTRTLTILAGVIGAVIVIIVALKRRFAMQTKKQRRPSSSSTSTQQLAGLRCATCKKNIVAERDAQRCSEPTCERPLHNDCLARHMLSAHGPESQVYR